MPRARVSALDLKNVGPDTPLRLDVAAEIAFPGGGMTSSGLRREAKRGRLIIETIAGKQFTTLGAIEEMRQKCRGNQKVLGSGSNIEPITPTAASGVLRPGFETRG